MAFANTESRHPTTANDENPARATPRLDEIDWLKGLLTLKMAGSHLAYFLIPGFALFGKFGAFSFGLFLFLFGLGHGLSSRAKTVRPLLGLVAVYLVGGVMTLLFAHWRDGGAMDGATLVGAASTAAWGALSLQTNLPMTEFIFPFIALGFAYVLLQRRFSAGSSGEALAWIGGALVVALAGTALKVLWPSAVGNMLYADGFPTLQMTPVFAVGLVLGRRLRDPGASMALRASAGWHAVGLCTMIMVLCQIAYVHNAKDVAWRASGQLSYVVCSVMLGLLAIQAAMVVGRYVPHVVSGFFSRVGRNALSSLQLQALGLPLVAFAAAEHGSQFVKVAMGAAFLVLVALVAGRRPAAAQPAHAPQIDFVRLPSSSAG